MTGKKSQSANGRTSKKTATNAMGRKQGSAPANPAANSNNRRRGGSMRLSGFLDDAALRRAEKIALGFQFRTSGLGIRTQSFSSQPKGERDQDLWQLDLMRAFTDWANALPGEGLSLAATLDILVFGKSCRQVDRARRKRNGYAKANLVASLEIYGKLFP